jgi:hypothetical protein
MKNRSKRAGYVFRIKPDGTVRYVRNGVEITPKELNDLYPIPVSLMSRYNFDRTREYINDRKAY